MTLVKNELKTIQDKIALVLLLISCGLFGIGYAGSIANLLLISCGLLLVHNIYYSCRQIKPRFLFLLFHLTVFIFLLGKPLIDLIEGNDWLDLEITKYYATEASVLLTLVCLFVSLLCVFLGGLISEGLKFNKKNKEPAGQKFRHRFCSFINSDNNRRIRIIALVLFGCSFIFKMIFEAERAIFMMQNSYVAYYAEFESQLPYFVYAMSTFMDYAMFVYLATLPKKRDSVIVMCLSIATTIPTFMFGERSALVIKGLFALTYFVFRDYVGDTKPWIGRGEKIMIIIGIPAAIILLDVMNYLRAGYAAPLGFFSTIIDFIGHQSVTFSYVCAGMAILPALRSQGVISYTFGAMIDYFKYGTIAQKLFGAPSLGSGNNMAQILMGNEMSHHLSYTLLGETKYLAGNGTGSSYIIELYADYGIAGIIVFSLLLGLLLGLTFRIAKKGLLPAVMIFCTVSGIVFLARSNVTGLFDFLWRIPFWGTLIIVLGGACLWHWASQKKKTQRLG